MEVPDVSFELGGEAVARDVCFTAVVPLLAFGAAVLTAAARVATGVVFLALVSLALVFDAGLAVDFTVFLTVVLTGLAAAFVAAVAVLEAGLSVLEMVFASLPATVFNIDVFAGFAAVLLLGAAALFVAVLLTLLAAALLVADLVTVAFMISSLNELPDLFDPPENASVSCSQADGTSSGAACDCCPRILPNDCLH